MKEAERHLTELSVICGWRSREEPYFPTGAETSLVAPQALISKLEAWRAWVGKHASRLITRKHRFNVVFIALAQRYFHISADKRVILR